jgi:hypothetical protein
MMPKNRLALLPREYVAAGGCALPGCNRICHHLGVPRADVGADLIGNRPSR